MNNRDWRYRHSKSGTGQTGIDAQGRIIIDGQAFQPRPKGPVTLVVIGKMILCFPLGISPTIGVSLAYWMICPETFWQRFLTIGALSIFWLVAQPSIGAIAVFIAKNVWDER